MRTKSSNAPLASETPLLAAQGISVRVGKRTLLSPTDLALEAGQWVALVGPNGAGKSTLLNALATLIPCEGRVVYRGEDVRRQSLRYRRALGVVMHEPLLYREMSAVENLALFVKLYGVAHGEEKIAAGLQQVGLARVMNEPIRRFSRGMMQRLSLARALLHEPELLLLDEPLSGIDDRGADDMMAIFRQVKKQGVSGIWVTHSWQRAWSVVDEMWEMDRGVIVRRTNCNETPAKGWRPLHSVSGITSDATSDEKLMPH